ncbi:MAG: tetratricopeptide repeat protein [Desulfuromonadaceae bacterium]|nr:tetratricopeptide repeat protein [Desulfuromonadaceae bacterium]MDD2854241.1 tetratricopeptide repeat protein [Desulfuromonadaceae bacterium]
MKKESILLAVVALIVGLLGGYLIFSISNAGNNQQGSAAIPVGSGSPTDYTQRIAQAEKIVAQDPKNLNAWISLGNDYFDTEQSQKSINAYSKALEIDPNNPNVLTDQGVMYRKMGWYDKALENFEKANKIDPKHIQSLFNTGIVYAVDLKDHVKARPYWKKVIEIEPNGATANQIKSMMQGAQ